MRFITRARPERPPVIWSRWNFRAARAIGRHRRLARRAPLPSRPTITSAGERQSQIVADARQQCRTPSSHDLDATRSANRRAASTARIMGFAAADGRWEHSAYNRRGPASRSTARWSIRPRKGDLAKSLSWPETMRRARPLARPTGIPVAQVSAEGRRRSPNKPPNSRSIGAPHATPITGRATGMRPITPGTDDRGSSYKAGLTGDRLRQRGFCAALS